MIEIKIDATKKPYDSSSSWDLEQVQLTFEIDPDDLEEIAISSYLFDKFRVMIDTKSLLSIITVMQALANGNTRA